MARRKFLFLQGVATPFFKKLSIAIRNKGHDTYRVNFCGGDHLFSVGLKSWRFNQPVEHLPHWLEEKHQKHRFTDAILFGDTRPVHTQAVALLRQKGVRIHVFEEGYLRPHWITLEQDGVNGHSNLLAKPTAFWQNEPSEKFIQNDEQLQDLGKTFGMRACHDISYRLGNALLKPFFRHYRTHRPANALLEYGGWAKRLPSIHFWHNRRDGKTIRHLVDKQTPYYLLPLQLDSDSQIRVHSPYQSTEQVIHTVMASFAKFAPDNSQLVIKNHPLSTGLIDHSTHIKQAGQQLGISERVVFLESGHLPTLLQHTRGTVLVNSTTGTSALYHGSPTCALGTAIFDIPGLTFQHGLDRFWTEGQPADKELYRRFRYAIIQETQINGGFYTKKGIQLAVEGSLQRMGITTVQPQDDKMPDTLPEELLPASASYGGGQLPEGSYLYKER